MISAPSRPAGPNTISDVEIKNCLTSAGRPATIDAVRLSAHSRGAAGLAATLAGRTVTPTLIDHVTVLDASDFAASLTRGLTASGVPASRVTAYNVVFGAFRGAAQNVQLSFGCVRSIGYARLITDGLATGRTPAPLPPGIAARVSALRLPPRGNFSTASPTPAGKIDLNAFCTDPVNRAALIAMRDGEPASPTDTLGRNDVANLSRQQHRRAGDAVKALASAATSARYCCPIVMVVPTLSLRTGACSKTSWQTRKNTPTTSSTCSAPRQVSGVNPAFGGDAGFSRTRQGRHIDAARPRTRRPLTD